MAVEPKKRGSKSISELKTAADLTDKLDELRKRRAKKEKDWKLNLAFYQGNQYVFVNRRGRLDSVPVDEGEKPRYRVRITSNQIEGGVQSLLAKYTKTKPVMTATPGSSSDSDLRAAQLANQLLESWHPQLDMTDKLEEALLWSFIAGQGYWKLSWDQHAGTPMRFTINPETGEPMTDDSQVSAFKSQLEMMGLPQDISDQVVYLGDVRIDVMSPFQVWLDDTAKTFSECKWAICEHNMTPDEIKSRFGKDIEADSIPVDPAAGQILYEPNSSGQDGSRPTVKKVYFGYFLPSAAMPKGRYVVWVENKNEGPQGARDANDSGEDILYDGEWDLPFNELPIVKFGGVRVPGAIYDDAKVTHARPLQKELNRTLSQIVQYKNLTIQPRVWAPVGSLKTRLTTEPGAVYEFMPVGGLRPEVEQLPSMPPYVFDHLQDITLRLREVFGLNDVTEATSMPSHMDSGIAIDLIQEMATDRMAPAIKLMENSLARAARLLLAYAQKYYIEPRMLKINGNGGSMQVKKFKGADLNGVDVIAESGSGLPRTRAGRQARIEKYIDMGVLQPHQAWKYLEIADMKALAQKWAADEDQAYREHEKLLKGAPLNPLAVQNAMMAVSQGINPETGEPLQSPEEAQQVLQTAALTPGIAENHVAHLDVHGPFMNSVEFENLPPEIQQLHVQHYILTQDAAKANAPIPDGQAPRINLALKGTVGPTVASKLVESTGVDATPEEFLEQPLETWVTDSVDKPDMEEAGNDPWTDAEKLIVVKREQESHELEQQKVMHEMALNEQKAALDAELATRKQDQAEREPAADGS